MSAPEGPITAVSLPLLTLPAGMLRIVLVVLKTVMFVQPISTLCDDDCDDEDVC